MKFAFALILALASAGHAAAHSFVTGSLQIEHPSARPTPPGARTGAVYFVVYNNGSAGDRLVGARSPAAAAVELHTMSMDGTLMKMRAVTALDVPPKGKLTLGSGEAHIMLIDLKQPLREGDKVPLVLTFEKAGAVDLVADVETPRDGASPHR